ncbi:hypothetical protein P12x_002963 [Tundrisphaera lichenicola]|uniref:hypothetical protein n=1 Tax=Tundrisphaera lichenicola TaxID=2029860 RepID=UPI003EC04368
MNDAGREASKEHGPWRAILLGAMAGGMGWGIRGQYGHETGAMIAGVLIGFAMVLLFLPRASSLRGARAVALTAIGIAFGGSMTYGQTIGLTKDPTIVGNWAALRWGLLGLAIKGGIWFGFAGAFLGIGVGGKRWRPVEFLLLLATMMGLIVLGIRFINRPFDPANRILPPIYFSADWYWQPNASIKPRPELWGGLVLALAGLVAYAQWVRRDGLARNMAVVGFLAGGLGFPLGECIQAFHAWNRPLFASGILHAIEPYINWWNMMETAFGAIGGGGLGLGLWWNRHRIAGGPEPDVVSIAPAWELAMIAAHLTLLVGAEFGLIPGVSMFLEFGPIMALIALPGVAGGRYWPYLFALPIIAVPIAGKTLMNLSYKEGLIPPPVGWVVLVAIPLSLMLVAALRLAKQGQTGQPAARLASVGLLTTTWVYFSLNFAFFHLPWPWAGWTPRTPNAVIFLACALGLTAAALGLGATGRWGRIDDSLPS